MNPHIPAVAIGTLLFFVMATSAQPPTPPPANADAHPKLAEVLTSWENESSNLSSMSAEVTCTRKNKVFNKDEVLKGSAKFARLANGMVAARVELSSPENPTRYEKYICTGSYIYVYRPEEKTVLVYTIPPTKNGQLPDDGALPFLFGMKAETARKRYQMKFGGYGGESKAGGQPWYSYVEIVPNFDRDRADFKWARLTLMERDWVSSNQPGMVIVPKGMPRQIFWVEPNNVEVTWDISYIRKNGPVAAADFAKPTLPPGWKQENVQNVPASTEASKPPTIVRPQGGK